MSVCKLISPMLFLIIFIEGSCKVVAAGAENNASPAIPIQNNRTSLFSRRGDLGLTRVVERIRTIVTKGRSNDTSCTRVLGQVASNGLPSVLSCVVSLQLSSQRTPILSPCLAKCVGQKASILRQDGLLDLPFVLQLVRKLPPQMQKIFEEISRHCLKEAFGLKSNDETCDSYRPLLECTTSNALKMSDKIINSCSEIPDAFKQLSTWVSRIFGGGQRESESKPLL